MKAHNSSVKNSFTDWICFAIKCKKLCCHTTTVLLFYYKIKRSVRVLKHTPWASFQTCIKYSRVQILWISFINNIIADSVHFCGIWWKSIRNKHSVWTFTWLHTDTPRLTQWLYCGRPSKSNSSQLSIYIYIW
jgi:hypothetical protein